MKTILDAFCSRPMRRLFVALAVTGGAAAVASAVVLSERPVGNDARTKSVGGDLLLAGRQAGDGTQPRATRSPKDAWRRLSPPWKTASSIPVPVAGDASLPSAGDVLGTDQSPADELAPTF
jgi:hypothetical protein